MKMDKDFASKNLFWLLLSGGVVLTVVAIFFLFFIVPGAIDKAEKDVKAPWDGVKVKGEPIGDQHIALAELQAKKEKAKETTVHEDAWKKQHPLTSFPKAFEDEFKMLDGRLAVEVAVQKDKPETYPENTPAKFHGVLKHFDPQYIVVEGKNEKGATKKQTFYRAPETKVSAPGGDEKNPVDPTFPSLSSQEGQFVAVTHRPRYFGDKLTDYEQERYDKTYKDQLKEVLLEAQPLNELGEPLVQLRGWKYEKGKLPPASELGKMGGDGKGGDGRPGGFPFPAFPPGGVGATPSAGSGSFFRYVGAWNREANSEISDEVWLAQEDVWVQREIFRLVKKANDYVANLKPIGPAKDGVQQYRNPYWDMWLQLAPGNKLKVTLRNRLDRPQRIDCRFVVQFGPKEQPRLIDRLNGPPLPPAGTTDAKNQPKDYHQETVGFTGQAPKGIVAVRQVLTWETAAVKRIDVVSVGGSGAESALSNRTAAKTLVSLRKEDDVKPEPVAGKDADGKPGGLPGDGKGSDIGRPGGIAGAPVDAARVSPHGLIKNRYLEVTPQARRIPIGVVLIVDQMHTARVQTAFADSALRFLTNQVIQHRYAQSLRPQEQQFAGGGEPGDAGGQQFPLGKGPFTRYPTGGAILPPGYPGSYPGSYPGGTPGMPGGSPYESASAGGDDPESNVELVIYGVVSIYERYPPRDPSATPTEQPKQ